MIHKERFEPASKVAGCLAAGAEIFSDASGHVCVRWLAREGLVARRWMTRGQDFYPTWHRQWPGGGTSTTALSQLVRWCKGMPVLPLSTWRYWCAPGVALMDVARIQPIVAAGYPEASPCVLCGRELGVGVSLDWWSLRGVTGPCCSMNGGCRQVAPGGTNRE